MLHEELCTTMKIQHGIIKAFLNACGGSVYMLLPPILLLCSRLEIYMYGSAQPQHDKVENDLHALRKGKKGKKDQGDCPSKRRKKLAATLKGQLHATPWPRVKMKAGINYFLFDH